MKRSSQHPSLWFLGGAAVGSLLTYFFDSARGAYRRNTLKDKTLKLTNETVHSSEKMMRHLKNQAQGLKSKASHLFTHEEVDDNTLTSRVRSSFGRKVRHSKAIKATVSNGIVTLSGPILEKEVDELLDCIRNVPGVKRIVDRLDVHKEAGNIPDLQGPGPEYLQG